MAVTVKRVISEEPVDRMGVKMNQDEKLLVTFYFIKSPPTGPDCDSMSCIILSSPPHQHAGHTKCQGKCLSELVRTFLILFSWPLNKLGLCPPLTHSIPALSQTTCPILPLTSGLGPRPSAFH